MKYFKSYKDIHGKNENDPEDENILLNVLLVISIFLLVLLWLIIMA